MIQLDDDSIVTLTDDEGNDFDFLLLDVVEYEANDYLVGEYAELLGKENVIIRY